MASGLGEQKVWSQGSTQHKCLKPLKTRYFFSAAYYLIFSKQQMSLLLTLRKALWKAIQREDAILAKARIYIATRQAPLARPASHSQHLQLPGHPSPPALFSCSSVESSLTPKEQGLPCWRFESLGKVLYSMNLLQQNLTVLSDDIFVQRKINKTCKKVSQHWRICRKFHAKNVFLFLRYFYLLLLFALYNNLV